MIPIEKITGRLGNKLFEFAALYSMTKDLGVDFYCQDEKYFKKYEADIKSMFGEGIGYIPEVGIHCRRAGNPINVDEPSYSENPFYVNLCDTSYYEEAMKLFPSETFLVISDDIEFCKEYFTKERFNRYFNFSEGNDEITDMNLLASCSGQIIANSSFSFWGAYLCPHPYHKVVAPKVENWYTDKVERTVCPKEWIRL